MKNKFIEPEIEILKFQCAGTSNSPDDSETGGDSGDVDIDNIFG